MKRFIPIVSILLFVGLLNSSPVKSQSLGFDTPPVFPQSIALDDSVPTIVPMGIKNYGTVAFAGNTPIYIVTKVMSSGLLVSRDSSFNVITQANIPPGQTYVHSYFEPYNTGRYVVGIDVVVIWPKAVGYPTHDSITYVIQITPAVGVAELLAENGFSVYPNPCSDQLNILNLQPSNPIERVRIYDLSGKSIMDKLRGELLDFSNIPEAVYFVEVTYKSGMRKVMKVQKENK